VQQGKEFEWYLPSQVRVRHGTLQLVAKRTRTVGRSLGKPHTYDCRSGMVTTYPGFRFQYGYVKIVAHFPAGAGLWPALWLAASNKRWPPEIDILEHWAPNRTAIYYHPSGAPPLADHLKMPTLSIGWHTFALLWSPSVLTWTIDGHRAFTTNLDIPHQSMYLLANLAEGSPPRAGWGCEGTMTIRSVQVWQPRHWIGR
jgi:beta-glucanase (GH16 family)